MAQASDGYVSTTAAAIGEERYDGDETRGFAHLALQLSFPTSAFTDDQADEETSIDRKGDLGADAVIVQADEQRILLFQSKSSAGLGETELHDSIASFLKVPDKLFSDGWVAKAHAELKGLANEFRPAIPKGY